MRTGPLACWRNALQDTGSRLPSAVARGSVKSGTLSPTLSMGIESASRAPVFNDSAPSGQEVLHEPHGVAADLAVGVDLDAGVGAAGGGEEGGREEGELRGEHP